VPAPLPRDRDAALADQFYAEAQALGCGRLNISSVVKRLPKT
jgi:3-hydroxyisobutyrate dehydrogenase